MRQRRGFTLIEVVLVTAIIAVLATLAVAGFTRYRSKAKLARVSADLETVSTALAQYANDNGYQYPADTDRSVPPGLERYLQGGAWPVSAWPHGVFDWDNWTNGGQQVYQISYRLCDLDDPESYCKDPVMFPNFTRNSSVFNCLQGPCIPHRDSPTVPGYCINCARKEVNY